MEIKYKCEYKRLLIEIFLCSMLFEISFLLSHMFCNLDFELIRLIKFQNKTIIEIIGL